MSAPLPIPGAYAQVLRDALVGGVVGKCVVCPHGAGTWLDLVALGGQPVVDARGHLTDHVALHAACASTLVEFWASLSDHDGPGDVTLPDTGPVTNSDAPSAVAPSPVADVPRIGAYAQRG